MLMGALGSLSVCSLFAQLQNRYAVLFEAV